MSCAEMRVLLHGMLDRRLVEGVLRDLRPRTGASAVIVSDIEQFANGIARRGDRGNDNWSETRRQ